MNTIKLTDIYGVDVEGGVVNQHPNFLNPKLEIRREIIDNLKEALSSGKLDIENLAPISVWENEDKETVVVDGFHRLTALVELANEEEDEWEDINCVHLQGDIKEMQVVQLMLAVQDTQSKLTEAEEVTAIKRLLNNGFNEADLLNHIGQGYSRLINKIKKISVNDPTVMEAVESGDITTAQAVKIVKNSPPVEQPKAVKEQADKNKEKKEPVVNLNLPKAWTFDKMMGYLQDNYRNICEDLVNSEEVDEDSFEFAQYQMIVMCMGMEAFPDDKVMEQIESYEQKHNL